jgi:hypothetical protein
LSSSISASHPDLTEALNSVRRIVAADSRDWAANRHDAFIYGIFRGWDDAETEISVAEAHGWSPDFLVRLHRLQAAVATALS